jgi:hypothetical protein
VPRELDCKLIWQSPSNQVIFAPGDEFAVGWNVRNIGTAAWDVNSVEFVYLGGAKLHGIDTGPLDTTVAPGQTIVLSVNMIAPRRPARYTTNWGLRQGDVYFCRLMLSITVEE